MCLTVCSLKRLVALHTCELIIVQLCVRDAGAQGVVRLQDPVRFPLFCMNTLLT